MGKSSCRPNSMQKYATVPGMRWLAAASATRRVDPAALLQEGAHRLAAVVADRARRHRLAGDGVRGVDVQLERLVEGTLAERLGCQAPAARRACQRLGLRGDLSRRHDAVHETPREGGLRVDRVAGEQHLERLLAA